MNDNFELNLRLGLNLATKLFLPIVFLFTLFPDDIDAQYLKFFFSIILE